MSSFSTIFFVIFLWFIKLFSRFSFRGVFHLFSLIVRGCEWIFLQCLPSLDTPDKSYQVQIFHKKLLTSSDIWQSFKVIIICTYFDQIEKQEQKNEEFEKICCLNLNLSFLTKQFKCILGCEMSPAGMCYAIHPVYMV